jgi:TetR/AcrR family transcriptional repressor of nem operon
MLERYFADYQQRLTSQFSDQSHSARERLLMYFASWQETAENGGCHKFCLAVKLAAEVSDLSEPMRAVLSVGMRGICTDCGTIRLAQAEAASLRHSMQEESATSLYSMWVGASLLAKVHLSCNRCRH